MHEIKFVYPVDGSAPPVETVIEIDPRYDDFKGNRISFDLAAGMRMIEILGTGYGLKKFHIVDEDALLVECRIVSMGAECVIQFLRFEPLPLGQR